jgi:anaerobic selenocysteine-containing dehydrogenase
MDDNIKGRGGRLTRRHFLTSAAAVAVVAAGDKLISGHAGMLVDVVKAATGSTTEIKPSFCSGCHQPTCSNLVTVTNGVAVGLMGDPASPVNKGMLCPRGLAAINSLYNPYRVKTPLKRTNPSRKLEDDPKWVEITWEEALNTTGAKLKDARDTNPDSFVYFWGFGFEETRLPFGQAFGTSNTIGTPGPLCPEHFSSLHLSGTMLDRIDLERCNYVVILGRSFGGDYAIASGSSRHFADAVERGMKVVSVNPVNDRQGQVGEWVPIRPGTDAAFGLALLNVIIHEIGRYDEWWLKVRSNAPYLVPDTKQEIKGSTVYMEDYARDPHSKKPLVWDTAKNRAVPFDSSKGETYALTGTYQVNGQTVKPAFQLLKDFVAQYTPEWASKQTTIPAATIREIANNLVREAKIGSFIDIDGYKFPYRPACVNIGRGSVSNRLGEQAYKALCTVNVLLGAIDVPGSMLGCSNQSWYPYLKPDEDGILTASHIMHEQVTGIPFVFPPKALDMGGIYPVKHATPHLAWKAIADPDRYYINYPVKVLIFHASNPIACNANREDVLKAVAKIPFIASLAYHFDEATQIADIVMPEDHSLERTQMYRMFRNEKDATDETRGLMGTLVKRPAVKRTFNTMNVNDIFIALAQRAGFLAPLNMMVNKTPFLCMPISTDFPPGMSPEFELSPGKAYSWEEIVERKIKSDYGPNAGFQDFAKTAFKGLKLATIKESYNYYYAPDNAIRQPIYYEKLARIGKQLKANMERVGATVPNCDMDDLLRQYSGFTLWYEPLNFGTTKEHPFKVANWKTHYMVTNTYGNVENPWLQEIIDKYVPDLKVVLINRAAAKKMGYEEGQRVRIESQWGGSTEGKLHLTEMIHPEVVGIGGNFGRFGLQMNPIAKGGAQFNQLVSGDEATIDPVGGGLDNSPRVRLVKV